MKALRVAGIDFTASDLEATRAFYEALGFETVGTEALDDIELALLGLPGALSGIAWGDPRDTASLPRGMEQGCVGLPTQPCSARRLTLRLGRQRVSFLGVDPPGRPYPAGSTSTDLWFQHIAIAVSDMGEAHARVIAAGARPITRDGPQTLPENTGGVTAFKFRDPDGHPLELLAFPEGVGAACWQAGGGASPFLGIDHTAIAVGDAVAAGTFFAGLGFVAGAPSHNRGPGQERLDAVAGDRVLVVPLNPTEAPPHVELLAYETGLRRPMPPDTRADDLWATRIVVAVERLDAAAVALGGGRRAALLHDPDRHAVMLVEDGVGTGVPPRRL